MTDRSGDAVTRPAPHRSGSLEQADGNGIKVGLIFEHRHWLDSSTNAPLKCKVTRITRDRVYYRGFYGLHEDGSEWLGGAMWLDRAKFEATYGAN